MGIDVFECGHSVDLEIIASFDPPDYDTSLYDILKAYVGLREKNVVKTVIVAKRKNMVSERSAAQAGKNCCKTSCDWSAIDHYLIYYLEDPAERRTAMAAGFGASLELVREGLAEIRQGGRYEPVYLRAVPKSIQKTPNRDKT